MNVHPTASGSSTRSPCLSSRFWRRATGAWGIAQESNRTRAFSQGCSCGIDFISVSTQPDNAAEPSMSRARLGLKSVTTTRLSTRLQDHDSQAPYRFGLPKQQQSHQQYHPYPTPEIALKTTNGREMGGVRAEIISEKNSGLAS